MTTKPLNLGANGALIKRTTERLGLTDKQAADYFGVPVFTIRKWLTGEREPGAAVARLLEILGALETMNPSLHDYFLPLRNRNIIKESEHN